MDKRLFITFTLLLISSLGVFAQSDSVLCEPLTDAGTNIMPPPTPPGAIEHDGASATSVDTIKYNEPTGIPMLRSYKKVIRRYKVVKAAKSDSVTKSGSDTVCPLGNTASPFRSNSDSITMDANSALASVSNEGYSPASLEKCSEGPGSATDANTSMVPTAVYTQTSVVGRWSAESRSRQLTIKSVKRGQKALTIPDLVEMLKGEVETRPDSDGIFPLQDQEAILSLSTNAVGWLLLNSNVTAEISVGESWAIGIPLYFGALDWGRSTRKVRLFGGRLELRKYYPIGSKYDYNHKKGEWFVGGAFDLSLFNVAFPGGKWRYQSKRCHDLAVGFSFLFGYRRYMSQDRRWFMDFGLGAGVYDLHYDRYFNQDKHYYDAQHRTKFLLDYIGVSIGYRFDLRKKISNNPFRQLNIH